MATKRKAPGTHLPAGQPTKYKPEYCELLLKHMQGGLSFETFGATIGTSRATLYLWEKAHPEFMDAKGRGQDASELFWETLGRTGISGQLKRVSSEDFDANGNVTRRRHAPAQFSSSGWGIVMRSRFKYRERLDVHLSKADGFEGQTTEEIAEDAARIAAELAAIAKRRK